MHFYYVAYQDFTGFKSVGAVVTPEDCLLVPCFKMVYQLVLAVCLVITLITIESRQPLCWRQYTLVCPPSRSSLPCQSSLACLHSLSCLNSHPCQLSLSYMLFLANVIVVLKRACLPSVTHVLISAPSLVLLSLMLGVVSDMAVFKPAPTLSLMLTVLTCCTLSVPSSHTSPLFRNRQEGMHGTDVLFYLFKRLE